MTSIYPLGSAPLHHRLAGFLSFLVLGCFLAGCGGNPVNTVRDGLMDIDQSTTIGQAFDNYQYYRNVTWRSFEQENGRVVVEAVCTYDVSEQNVIDAFNTYAAVVPGTPPMEGPLDVQLLDSLTHTWQWVILPDDLFELQYAASEYIGEIAIPEAPFDDWIAELGSIYDNAPSYELGEILVTSYWM